MAKATEKTETTSNLYSLNRAALGASANLGDLYDARKDDFKGISIFKKTIGGLGVVNLVDSQFTDFHFVSNESSSEKSNKLDVSASLSVSVLAGMVTLEGSGRYLSDKKTSARSVEKSLLYNIKTKKESFNAYDEKLKEGDAYSLDALKTDGATHVVVGIEWGANSIVTCKYENKENNDIKKIEGHFSAELNKMSLAISGKADVTFDETEKETGVKFEVKMYGDFLPEGEELPTTLEAAMELMKKIPTFISKSNEGKGKQLSYRLLPIDLFKKLLNQQIQGDAFVKSIEETSFVRVVQLVDQMSTAQQQLRDFYQDADEFRNCVLPEDINTAFGLLEQTRLQESKFRTDLSNVLTKIREGTMDVKDLEDLMKEIEESKTSPQKLTRQLETWSSVIDRINFARLLIKAGAKFIGLDSSLNRELARVYGKTSYVLYFSQATKENLETWGGNRQLFFQEMKEKAKDADSVFFVVDCDIHKDELPESGSSVIKVIRKSEDQTTDLLAERQRLSRISYVHFNRTAERNQEVPKETAPLTMVCPGKTCNPSPIHDWNCFSCTGIVQYGFDQHVYCKCGKSPVADLEFKCSDPKHGDSKEKHDDAYLKLALASLPLSGAINILVMGEETKEKQFNWMKDFVTFLTYDSLERFEKAKQSVNGDISGPKFKPGQTKPYIFTVGSTNIRFIPGPALSPSGEAKPGDDSFKKQLTKLGYLKTLNAVCVLLGQDGPNAKAMFQNYWRENQSWFGLGAGKNNLFAFSTLPGGEFGQPMLSLQELVWGRSKSQIEVSNDTVFSFQTNPNVRLAGFSAKKMKTQVIIDLASSWRENVAEAERMLNRIRHLDPIAIVGPRVESVFSGGLKYVAVEDESKDLLFPLSERGLSTGDCVILNVQLQGTEGLGLRLVDNIDSSGVPLSYRINQLTKQGLKIAAGFVNPPGVKYEEPQLFNVPTFEIGHAFELKIACGEGGFEFFIDGKPVHNYNYRIPTDKVSYVALQSETFTFNSIEVARLKQ